MKKLITKIKSFFRNKEIKLEVYLKNLGEL